ncbi:MAG: PorP/SprF family type IX secretion system membrane protein [Bacteroidetes bacterium]|nr:PorP/SprF family type IX secretion system membrane protein [Bacteroidota bacterium]MBU1719922.1 PorP/SprF family type IX secretion system membrane protein [Bacteroidota bacterium]
MKRFVISLICLLCAAVAKPQDIHFSQYNDMPLTLNPATTGDFVGGVHRLNMIFRDQWGKTAPYQTLAGSFDLVAFDGKWMTDYMGFGIVFFSDKAGDGNLSTTQANFSMSYFKSVDPFNTIILGFQGGFAQRSLDYTKLYWDSQYDGVGYDPDLPSGERSTYDSFLYPDITWGIIWALDPPRSYNSRLGYSMHHINQPDIGMSDPQLVKHVVHWNADFNKYNTNFHLLPTALYMRQGTQQEITYGFLLGFDLKEAAQITGWVRQNFFAFGFMHRWSDALVFQAKLNMKNLEFGISYDTNLSNFRTATNGYGGFEASIKYTSQIIPKWKKGASRY